MPRWSDFEHFRHSTPRAAKGGIRAQSQRGGFGESWWAKRWIGVLESFSVGGRLQRGRSYARMGQVLAIVIEKGAITAKVQGSRPTPYAIRIAVKTLKRDDWKKLAEAASSQAIVAARLLAGEMPREIESAFEDAGLSLFPQKSGDLKTECSCPDSSNPCKHIAAVYYLLGEEFDRDPFLIFKMRGMDRDEFLRLVTEKPSAPVEEEEVATEPLPSDPTTFWGAGSSPPLPVQRPSGLAAGAALARRLGNFPFWRGNDRFFDTLEPVYARAASIDVNLPLREPSGEHLLIPAGVRGG